MARRHPSPLIQTWSFQSMEINRYFSSRATAQQVPNGIGAARQTRQMCRPCQIGSRCMTKARRHCQRSLLASMRPQQWQLPGKGLVVNFARQDQRRERTCPKPKKCQDRYPVRTRGSTRCITRVRIWGLPSTVEGNYECKITCTRVNSKMIKNTVLESLNGTMAVVMKGGFSKENSMEQPSCNGRTAADTLDNIQRTGSMERAPSHGRMEGATKDSGSLAKGTVLVSTPTRRASPAAAHGNKIGP
mmetsp:Transcript_9249/g.17023  ORF Transcript_9249/g.17023 Transcript_9249/m.17023 type:complete len:245 (+) Transcript_9249:180-914(+)